VLVDLGLWFREKKAETWVIGGIQLRGARGKNKYSIQRKERVRIRYTLYTVLYILDVYMYGLTPLTALIKSSTPEYALQHSLRASIKIPISNYTLKNHLTMVAIT